MIELYPDQKRLADRVRNEYVLGSRRVILCAPTGFGKTVVACIIMRMMHEKGKRALVVAHRRELLSQFLETAAKCRSGECGLIVAGKPHELWKHHQIASKDTLIRRKQVLEKFKPDLLIFDEAHHCAAKTYMKVMDNWSGIRVLGLTATPERPDGKPLTMYDVIVQGETMRELIGMKRLSDYDYYSVPAGITGKGVKMRAGDYAPGGLGKELLSEKAKRIANVSRAIRERATDRKWLAFAPTVETSKRLVEQVKGLGLQARHLDAGTPAEERERVLGMFKEGHITGLSNVGLFTEGLDVPSADCCVLMRRTKSHVVWLQAIGRVLRYVEGKRALILDCAGSLANFSYRAPCGNWEWSLFSKATREERNAVQPIMAVCPHCFLLQAGRRQKCMACGRSMRRPQKRKPHVEVDVPVVKINFGATGRTFNMRRSSINSAQWDKRDVNRAAFIAWQKRGLSGLLQLADSLGYKEGWARHRLERLNANYGHRHGTR